MLPFNHICNRTVLNKCSGGSILADFLSRPDLLTTTKLYAVVRSEEQFQALSKLSLSVLKFELDEEAAVAAAVEQNQSNTHFQQESLLNLTNTYQLISSSMQQTQQILCSSKT
jgi:hypothetical protein